MGLFFCNNLICNQPSTLFTSSCRAQSTLNRQDEQCRLSYWALFLLRTVFIPLNWAIFLKLNSLWITLVNTASIRKRILFGCNCFHFAVACPSVLIQTCSILRTKLTQKIATKSLVYSWELAMLTILCLSTLFTHFVFCQKIEIIVSSALTSWLFQM